MSNRILLITLLAAFPFLEYHLNVVIPVNSTFLEDGVLYNTENIMRSLRFIRRREQMLYIWNIGVNAHDLYQFSVSIYN